MKIDNMTINTLMNKIINFKGGIKNYNLQNLVIYFNHRIDKNNLCSKSELQDLEQFIEFLERNLYQDKYKILLNKIKKRANVLKVLSLNKNTEITNLKDEIESIGSYQIKKYLTNIFNETEKNNPNCIKIENNLNNLDQELVPNLTEKQIETIKKVLLVIEDKLSCNKNFAEKNIKIFKEKIQFILKKIEKNKAYLKLFQKLDTKEIVIPSKFPAIFYDSIDYFNEHLEEVTEQNIIAVDNSFAVSLDGAFSIKKEYDYYVFDVFVADVPTFLKDNIKFCKEAYKRGTSFCIETSKNNSPMMIDIFPTDLLKNNLALKLNKMRIAIDFKFIILKDGTIKFDSVSRKKIKITNRTNFHDIKKLNSPNVCLDDNFKELILYKEMVEKVISKKENYYLKDAHKDFVSFSSLLVNYFIGKESEFAIYREKGKYVKQNRDFYTQSVTPLRRFVSNINLAFFLNQKGVVLFNRKSLNYTRDNEDEIIAHLNEREEIKTLAKTYPRTISRYL